MKILYAYFITLGALCLAFGAQGNGAFSCSEEQAHSLQKAFGEVSFEEQMQQIAELGLLRKQDDPKLLKKIELLMCATQILDRLPSCSQAYVLDEEDDETSLLSEFVQISTINDLNTRYGLLKFAIAINYKELIELIYSHVDPSAITASDNNSCDSDSILSDLELVVNQLGKNDIIDLVEFLMKFKDLKQLQASYPEVCQSGTYFHPRQLSACLIIEKELEKRQRKAKDSFLSELDRLADEELATKPDIFVTIHLNEGDDQKGSSHVDSK